MRVKRYCCAVAGIMILPLLMSFAPDWVTFTSADRTFSIQFPIKPTLHKQKIPSELGDVNMQLLSAKTGDEKGYGVMVMDYPDSANLNSDSKEATAKVFRSSIDGGVHNLEDGKLLSEEDITIDGFPGREFKVEFMEGKGLIIGRAYFVNKRVYMLQAGIPKEDEDSDELNHFLNSFRLLKKQP